jgi:hypothetical protein
MASRQEQTRYERSRIERISEEDFWSAWSRREPGIREAVALGRSARRGKAYPALAEFHRGSLAGEYAFVREAAAGRNAAPDAARQTSALADDVRRGRIRGWWSQVIDFGRRIDFNANFGQSGQYGFHYLGWLVPLIDRFLMEGRPADLDRIVEIVRQYYQQRTRIRRRIPGLNPVYYELGAYAKTEALLPAYLALIHRAKPGAGEIEPFLKLFLGFGRSLMRIQRSGYRPGNWQIVGCGSLFRLGAAFPELREAPAWRSRALELMEAHVKDDFFADGGHKERCWSYGWMSLRGVIGMYETGRRTGLLPARAQRRFIRTIRRAFRWFRRTLTPSGICPAYGDGDLTRAHDILAAAARYLPKAEAAADDRKASVCLKPSGYAIMRDDGSRQSRYLNVNFGPTGGGHTHRDLLDFNVWAFGEPILEEVGRFDSYDHPLNPFFCSPEAHNQIVIDHHAMLRHLAEGNNVVWRSNSELDYFGAWHDAFRGGPGHGAPVVRVHRHILFRRGGYWLIYDVIEPAKETILTVSSYLHSPRPFQVLGPGRARVKGSPSCIIAFAQPEELKRLETGADVAAAEVTAARVYPERHFLRARTWAPNGYTGCLRLAMLIYPFRGRPPRVGICPVRLPGSAPGVAEAFRVVTPEGCDRVVFDRSKRQVLSLGRRKGSRPSSRHQPAS